MMKRAFKLGTLCVGIAVLLCACGNASKEETETVGESVTETEDSNIYAYDYDVESMVKLGEYKGLTYTIVDTSVSEDEVQADIDDTLNALATKEQIKDRAVESGDTVNIDYEGLLDGTAFPGGTAKAASLEIGSGRFIEGFEEGLLGVKPGEATVLNLTFPEDYKINPDLAGKDVVFNVTVNYIEGKDIIPELDDTFVEGLGLDGVKTVDEYRKYVESQIKAGKEADAQNSRQQELFEKAVSNAEVNEYPAELVEQYKQEYVNYYEQYAAYFGIELKDFLTQYLNQTEEEFYEAAEVHGKDVTGNMLVACAIAKAEGFEVTDDIYAEKTSQYAEESGYADAVTLEADYGYNYLKQAIINEAVIDIIEKNATGVEASETEAE